VSANTYFAVADAGVKGDAVIYAVGNIRHVLEDVTNPDLVRDLFIRLQSGTALSRQQIRDAWPGGVGPFVQGLAGKLSQRPTLDLFALIDKRGTRGEDEDLKDPYVTDRQTCAQFLRIFLARERDPRALVGVAANDLDALYHEYTDLNTAGQSCQEFLEVLKDSAKVFKLIAPLSAIKAKGNRTKVRKLDAFATVMFFHDIRKNPNLRLDQKAYLTLAHKIAEFEKSVERPGKGTSGTAIRTYYEKFRDQVTTDVESSSTRSAYSMTGRRMPSGARLAESAKSGSRPWSRRMPSSTTSRFRTGMVDAQPWTMVAWFTRPAIPGGDLRHPETSRNRGVGAPSNNEMQRPRRVPR